MSNQSTVIKYWQNFEILGRNDRSDHADKLQCVDRFKLLIHWDDFALISAHSHSITCLHCQEFIEFEKSYQICKERYDPGDMLFLLLT